MRTITYNIPDDKLVISYLSLFGTSLSLTSKETQLLEALIINYMELINKVKEPYLTELLLSTDRKKVVIETLGIEASNYSNLFKSLKEKGAFTYEDGGSLILNPMLVPSNKVTFIFNTETKFEPIVVSPPSSSKPKTEAPTEPVVDAIVTPIEIKEEIASEEVVRSTPVVDEDGTQDEVNVMDFVEE